MVAFLCFSIPARSAVGALDLGPAFDNYSLTFELGRRTEILGPLLSYETRDSQSSWGFHPLFSFTSDSTTDFAEFDLLYPVLTYDRFGPEHRFQLLQLLSFGGGETQSGAETDRVSIFPFYFQQRSSDPNKRYTALFPIYGHLENRILRDEIDFVLFPAYSKTRKRDVITRNYLYPIFHLREGNRLKGWQVWPLAGAEQRDPGLSTNVWGDLETVPGHRKSFIAWPLFFRNQTALGTERPESLVALLPFFSLQRSPRRESSTIPWPIGVTYTVDHDKGYREWGAPWPLVVFARGEGKTVNRLWPLFGQAEGGGLESDFYLWPLYKYDRATAEPLDRERHRILFFLYSDLIERNTVTGTALHRTDLWPLFTARSDHAGNERLQIGALLEPFLPNSKSVERNYSPLWSIWRSERNAKTGRSSQSFLWNLYRADAGPAARKYSLLFGLIRYQSGPEGRSWRVFYIPFGRRGEPARVESEAVPGD